MVSCATVASKKDIITIRKFLSITPRGKLDKKLVQALRSVNDIFAGFIFQRKEFIQYTPYKITVQNLRAKNQWSQGQYVAINNANGTLTLKLNYKKLLALKEFPVMALVWVIFHEFRHKIQLHHKAIQSVINYPNWAKFNEFMQKEYGKNQDLINHVFHELNPAEVDANIFACEMTGLAFNGNAFNITDQSLSLLQQNLSTSKQSRKKLRKK